MVFPSNASSNWSALGGTTVTPNATTSPEGTANATAMYETNTTSNFVLYKDFTVATGAVSIYAIVKTNGRNIQLGDLGGGGSENARFNLVDGTVIAQNTSNNAYIESYGNGWYKVGFSMTKSGTLLRPGLYTLDYETSSSTHVGDSTKGIFIYHVQGEQASYSTSVIPTTTATVTRLADACSKTGISSLIGQTEGTLFVDFDMTQTSDTHTPISIADGTSTSNFVLVYKLNTNVLSTRIRVGGVDQPFINSPVLASGRHKFAFAYKQNDLAFYVDGVLAGTSSSANIPALLSKLSLNEIGVGINQMFGGTRQALVFKTRLSNASLAELTTL